MVDNLKKAVLDLMMLCSDDLDLNIFGTTPSSVPTESTEELEEEVSPTTNNNEVTNLIDRLLENADKNGIVTDPNLLQEVLDLMQDKQFDAAQLGFQLITLTMDEFLQENFTLESLSTNIDSFVQNTLKDTTSNESDNQQDDTFDFDDDDTYLYDNHHFQYDYEYQDFDDKDDDEIINTDNVYQHSEEDNEEDVKQRQSSDSTRS